MSLVALLGRASDGDIRRVLRDPHFIAVLDACTSDSASYLLPNPPSLIHAFGEISERLEVA